MKKNIETIYNDLYEKKKIINSLIYVLIFLLTLFFSKSTLQINWFQISILLIFTVLGIVTLLLTPYKKNAIAQTLEKSKSIAAINIDVLGFINEISHNVSLLLGYSQEELLKKNILVLLQQDNDYEENQNISTLQYLSNKKKIKLRHKSGESIVALINVENQMINHIESYTIIFQNINEIDEKYQFKINVLNKILNLAKNAIYAIDHENNILFYNKKFLDHWDLDNNLNCIKIGKDQSELFSLLLNKIRNSSDLQSQLGINTENVTLLSLKNGKYYLICTNPIIIDEQKIGQVFYFRNITKEKEAEEKLSLSNKKLLESRKAAMSLMEDANRKKVDAETILKKFTDSQMALQNSEERFRNLVEKSNEWFWEIDSNGIFTYSGPQVFDILGYKQEDIIGAGFYDFFPSLESWRIYELIKESSDNKTNLVNVESYYYHKNNDKRIVELFANPIIDKNDEVAGHRGLIRDITLRKRSEELLKESKERAELATQAKSIFLANMGHEIRTPLNAVIGTNYLLNKTDLDSRQKNYSERIEISAKLLLRTINDILDFSKIEAGALTLEDLEFNINEVARNISNIHAPAAQQKGLDILVSTCLEAERFLTGDPLRLEQITNNLVSNAIKFTEQGHILIKIESDHREGNNHYFNISVTDSGMGIAPENISKLFSEFVQEDSSTTRRFGGTGLGLSICKKLTEMMGGQISITSELGKGTTFKVSLSFPRLRKVTTLIERIDDLRDKKILIISHVTKYRDILQECCRHFCDLVEKTESFKSAEDLIIKESKIYDVIFIDQREDFKKLESFYKLCKEKNILLILALKSIEISTDIKFGGEKCFNDQLLSPFSPIDVYNVLIGLYNKRLQIKTKSQKVINDKNILNNVRILIVEDNVVNQEVAREILEGMGAQITIASNGKEATDRDDIMETFDIILMDVQMPVMDGFTASEVIRKEKKLLDIPILALTASIASEDKEKAIQIGINDYLVKPLEPENMMKAILKWTGLEKRLSDFDQAETEDENDDILQHLEKINHLDYKLGLNRVGGSRENYLKFLDMFLQDKSNFEEKVSKMFKEKNWKGIKEEAHSLAGVAGLLGASKLYDLSKELENYAKEGQQSNVEESIKKTCEILNLLTNDLKNQNDH